MSQPLRVLMVEDSEEDALLIARELKRAGYAPDYERVDTAPAMRAALERREWDLVLSDSSMPGFSGPRALAVLKECGLDVPFIVVSGTIGEDNAVEMMRAGANDYVLKHNLARLAVAVARELRDAESRRGRLKAEAELARQREALYQSEKLASMGQLLAGVAHELNNPLSIVTGQASLLRRALADRPEAARAEKIERAAERCARIVKNFLALARQHPPERKRVLVPAVIEEALELVAYPFRVDGIEVKRELEADLPALWADGHQLQQVLINLLTNAHHALQSAPVERQVTIACRHDAARRRIVLEVSDSGPGIAPDIQQRIFEPFFTTKPEGQGTGLGLPLCAGIVGNHGGTISVESRPGAGATFRIELPAEMPAEAEAEVLRSTGSIAASGAHAILVVDDEREVAELLADVLTSAGYTVDLAGAGQPALALLGQRSYDLVLCDLRMPGMDGPALYRETKARHPGLESRFIFLTGDTVASEARRFLEESGRPHVAKPFDLPELERLVARELGREA